MTPLSIGLAIMGAMGIVGAIGPIKNAINNDKQYGSELERFIVNSNPQHAGDIDRLTFEYEKQKLRGRI